MNGFTNTPVWEYNLTYQVQWQVNQDSPALVGRIRTVFEQVLAASHARLMVIDVYDGSAVVLLLALSPQRAIGRWVKQIEDQMQQTLQLETAYFVRPSLIQTVGVLNNHIANQFLDRK